MDYGFNTTKSSVKTQTIHIGQHYMEFVEIMIDFIRAYRIGDWKLHLQFFAKMLPWLSTYDHLNYARWTVYYADMLSLEQSAPEVYKDFVGGNFAVKKTNGAFNQVPIDQATGWLKKLCKLSNGIIGIIKTDSAWDLFCITCRERAIISEATKYLLGMGDEDESLTTCKDSFCPEHHTKKLISSQLLSSSNDLTYFLCVDQKLLS